MSITRRLDLKPSKKSIKHCLYKNVGMPVLPAVIDQRNVCGPIEDQGQLGSCTSFAMAGMLGFLQKRDWQYHIHNQAQEYPGPGFKTPSHLFIYYNERQIESTPDNDLTQQDCGASIADSVQSVLKYGACMETLWPYDQGAIFTRPPKQAYDEARGHEASQYNQITSLTDAQEVIARGYVFVMGISVYESFMSQETAQTGMIQAPTQDESLLGGHAVCVVGYDNMKRCFILRNSWGTSWGDQGHGYLPYSYFNNPNLASDFWTIIK